MDFVNDSVFDPALDLVLGREIDVPRHLVWAAWTMPEHVVKWFTPAPWTTVACEIDLRPGGKFRTVMRSPEGEEFDSSGCYLEVVKGYRLVWTDALLPGYRPAEKPFMTASITLEDCKGGTKYTARAIHANAEGRASHEAMGFQTGWSAALDQLIALMKEQ